MKITKIHSGKKKDCPICGKDQFIGLDKCFSLIYDKKKSSY